MVLAIATNSSALMASAAASSVNKDMETSMERLATGKRINSASDDAAGVAIASRLTAEIRGTNQAIRNAQDGQALIDTAEGAHKEIENILQRMRELAVQGSNDTNNATDRSNLQLEMDALVEEIDRISSVSSWAGESLIDAQNTFKFQIGARGVGSNTANEITVSMNAMSSAALGVGAGNAAVGANGATLTEVGENVLQVGGTPVTDDVYSFSVNGSAFEVELTADDGTNFDYSYTVDGGAAVTGTASGNDASAVAGVIETAISAQSSNHPGLTVSSNSDGAVTVTQGLDLRSSRIDQAGTDADATNVAGTINTASLTINTVAFAAGKAVELDLSTFTAGTSTIRFDINGTEVAVTPSTSDEFEDSIAGYAAHVQSVLDAATNLEGFTFEVAVDGSTSTQINIGVVQTAADLLTDESATAGQSSDAISISSQADASAAIATIDAAIETVNTQRSELGAVSNRLDHTVNNLTSVVTNLEAGKGRIEDADFAAESTSLAKAQILQQASTAMLAQANASKQGVLSLLQG